MVLYMRCASWKYGPAVNKDIFAAQDIAVTYFVTLLYIKIFLRPCSKYYMACAAFRFEVGCSS